MAPRPEDMSVRTWRSAKLRVSEDTLAGRGVVAVADIARDEIVAIKAGLVVTRDERTQVTAAAGAFYDAAVLGAVRHRPDDDLEASIAAARRRTVSGAWAFDRRATTAGPIIAASLARWTARNPTLRSPQIL